MASSNGEPHGPGPASQPQSLSGENPLRHTMEGTTSPRPASAKVVSIVEEPETIAPPQKEKVKTPMQHDHSDLEKAAKRFRASVTGKRLSGRPSIERLGSAARASMAANPSLSSLLSEDSESSPKDGHGHGHGHGQDNLAKRVHAWLEKERSRRSARRAKRKTAAGKTSQDTGTPEHRGDDLDRPSGGQERRPSDSSEGSVALEQLSHILERTLSLKSLELSPRKRRPSHGYKLSSIMKRHSMVGSDTDYFEGAEELVPSCDVVLDNSKTMAYGAGGPDSKEEPGKSGKKSKKEKEKEAWATFKYEIVRLSHTLRLKGWRRVPLDLSGEISVERLSGALTNAVYVVSPPEKLTSQDDSENSAQASKSPPPKLLLRIYGPQVEHLIDRESELQILRRLARKRIGPRLLGTFSNGRFEEFFYAKPLTPADLHNPDTSKRIAKRMRELHEGIDLLRDERDAGPFVWRNWDKWVDRCEQIVTWLDKEIQQDNQQPTQNPADEWRQRGLVCGVEWPVFRQMVQKYRVWLEDKYGGLDKINERLVFAHNDTQYGNILRLEPSGKSPLLLPSNEHKQLVVIDFEYANANLPGLEFANHFTEWCYNYHDQPPYKCTDKLYPTIEDQRRFIKAYLLHNPEVKAPGGSASNPPTPHFGPLPTSGSSTALAATAAPTSISAFMLDSRAPPGEKYSYFDQETQREDQTEAEVQRLMAETRLWRLANSVQWTAWGIVQAHIPGLPDFESKDEDNKPETSKEGQELESATAETRAVGESEKDKDQDAASAEKANENGENGSEEDDEEEFDYLGYAQERAMFVWGDAVNLGIVKMEDLPEDLRKKVKIVQF